MGAYSDEVAVVHDYFVQDGGGERMAIELSRLLPTARVYTSFFDNRIFGGRVDPERVSTWPLQDRVHPGHFRGLVQLYPFYFTGLDLRHVRLVISNTSAFAKAVRTSSAGLHVSYVHTPMRFAYETGAYVGRSSFGPLARAAALLLRKPLAAWDRQTALRPDVLVGNSHNVRERIQRRWARDAEVIYPAVDVDEFTVSDQDDGYLLIAARLLAYRRIEVAVRAASALRRQMIVVGDGPERERLERMAGPTVRFTGWLPRAQLVDYFERCHAYVVPGEEDFGIAPVEAMAAGKPVVALARGGALETVVDGVTGILYSEPTPTGMARALEQLDSTTFDRQAIRGHAERFGRRRFFDEWRALLDRHGVDRSLYDGES